jgi:hypothetical protein
MKKKFTISAVFILITFIGFAQCPSYFMRNNGNGICASTGSEIRMYYTSCPDSIPKIDSIYANGVNTNVTMLGFDASNCAKKGYISYCISSNLPPANGIEVFFTYGSLTGNKSVTCSVPEGGPTPGPTPVILSTFEVQRTDKNIVTATWKTEQEINSSRFEIQRSSNNSVFETVGTVVSPNSNSNIVQSYSFTDNNSLNEVSFYRIKMIDKDNSFTYSPIKTVKGTIGATDFSVYPNPSIGSAKITISDMSEPTKVMIFDFSGRLINQKEITNSNTLEINNLQKGGYIIKVTGEISGASSVKKLTVIN